MVCFVDNYHFWMIRNANLLFAVVWLLSEQFWTRNSKFCSYFKSQLYLVFTLNLTVFSFFSKINNLIPYHLNIRSNVEKTSLDDILFDNIRIFPYYLKVHLVYILVLNIIWNLFQKIKYLNQYHLIIFDNCLKPNFEVLLSNYLLTI